MSAMRGVWVFPLLVACFAGCSQDRFELGKTAFDSGDYATALREWRPLAEEGHAAAQSYLGLLYNQGKGLPQDFEQAARWFRLSAEQGYARAQFNLAAAYAEGKGVVQDCFEAYVWFYLAEAQGIERASQGIDYCAPSLSAEQIAEAERLARERQDASAGEP